MRKELYIQIKEFLREVIRGTEFEERVMTVGGCVRDGLMGLEIKDIDMCVSLEDNEVFVFGSNLAGSHGGGAARLAYERFGAVWGEGIGLHGQSYAIPTMQGGVETIKPYV